MVRSELVNAIAADHPALTASEADALVAVFFDTIIEHLAADGRVELRGFGVFTTRTREPRAGRNPRTGEAVDVSAKRVPHFKPGKEVRERVAQR